MSRRAGEVGDAEASPCDTSAAHASPCARVLLLFTLLTIVLTWPLSVHPASRVLWGGADTELFMWTLAWDAHAFAGNPLHIFDANIFAPAARTLAYSEHLIGSALFAAPVLWLTSNPVLAMNLAALVTVVLCGTGTYVLARRLGIGHAGAVVAGIIFAFSPPRFFRLGQLHLTAVQWLPFALAFLHGYLDTRRTRELALAAVCVTLQALSSGHGTIFLGVAMVALVAWRTVTARCPLPSARQLAIAGLVLLPVVLVAAPYRIVQEEVGLRRSLVNWVLNPQSYLASPSRLHGWLLGTFGAAEVNATAGAFLFPGIITLLLAATGVITSFCEQGARAPAANLRFYAALTLLAILLSIGPPLGIWPLVYWLPGFNFIRVPSRFVILAVLGLAVLAGAAIDALRRRAPGARGAIAVVVVTVALVAETAVVPLNTVAYRFAIPGVDRWLATQPGRFTIAEFPPAGTPGALPAARQQTVYMLHSTAHWQKTVHGYSGIEPAAHAALYAELRSFPSTETLDALRSWGVKYVVVHGDMYPPGAWEEIDRRLATFGDRLSIEYVDGPGRVYSLR